MLLSLFYIVTAVFMASPSVTHEPMISNARLRYMIMFVIFTLLFRAMISKCPAQIHRSAMEMYAIDAIVVMRFSFLWFIIVFYRYLFDSCFNDFYWYFKKSGFCVCFIYITLGLRKQYFLLLKKEERTSVFMLSFLFLITFWQVFILSVSYYVFISAKYATQSEA